MLNNCHCFQRSTFPAPLGATLALSPSSRCNLQLVVDMPGVGNSWLAPTPSKRWGELFFLAYSPVWISIMLGIVVPFQLYEAWGAWHYLLFGIAVVTPMILYPVLFPGHADRGKPWHDRYWVKAQLWLALFGFVGNYFWTHYFFQLLGASYTMPSHRINNVPIVMFLLTHPYFSLYHTLSNMLIRRTIRVVETLRARKDALSSTSFPAICAVAVAVGVFAYAVAFMETWTIEKYPYYAFKDRSKMYTVGSLFYAIYFFVSFPTFFLLDEWPRQRKHSLWRVVSDSLASAMAVTILLDLWRLCFGAIHGCHGDAPAGVPFISEES